MGIEGPGLRDQAKHEEDKFYAKKQKASHKNELRNKNKIANSGIRLTIIYPCIPVIPRVRVAVCRGMPKSNTVPVPATPVLETPRVFPYPCQTL
jgi:hypothetical protein